MRNNYYVAYNNIRNIDVGVSVITRAVKPSPQKRYEEREIPGKDGIVLKDRGYGNIDIPVSFNFISKTENTFDEHFRKIKKWLLKNKDNKLIFSDDIDYFYLVDKVTIDTPERLIKRLGKFTVTFNCKPHCYRNDGLEEILIENSLYNSYEETRPILRVCGEGYLKLNCNGNIFEVNVAKEVIIDTELGQVYRIDQSIKNVTSKGAFRFLWLKEEENTFEYDKNKFKIYIKPRWRAL